MRKKVWRKKFAAIAARDRQFTVKNIKKNIGIDNTNRKYCDWKLKKSPQPKSSWLEMIDGKPTLVKSTSLHVNPKKMNHVEYMEKLTQHKLAKWERKHPKPCREDDLFKEEMIPLWEDERRKAEERLRDFVVSIYDKLCVLGNRIDRKSGTIVGKTEAKIKDVDGKGHNVDYPHLQESDQLYKNATKAAQDIIDKDGSIIDCDLKNHKGNQKRPLIHAKRNKTTFAKTNVKDYKRQKGRIILPQAA